MYHQSGIITQVHHIIQRVLKMLDHIIQPIAISVFFFNAAIILAANSGKLVQIATIVTPINDFGIQNEVAIDTALSTINLPHKINPINPTAI